MGILHALWSYPQRWWRTVRNDEGSTINAYFWMGSSFNVGGAGCPGQNTLEGHVFIGSFSCWRDRTSYQTVSKKAPRWNLVQYIPDWWFILEGNPSRIIKNAPALTSRLMWTYHGNFHSMHWRKDDFATFMSQRCWSHFHQIYISGSSKRTDLWSNDVDASWPNFQCFCLFCGWGTPSVWKVHFRKHLPCRNECSLRSMHSPEKCQHKWF